MFKTLTQFPKLNPNPSFTLSSNFQNHTLQPPLIPNTKERALSRFSYSEQQKRPCLFVPMKTAVGLHRRSPTTVPDHEAWITAASVPTVSRLPLTTVVQIQLEHRPLSKTIPASSSPAASKLPDELFHLSLRRDPHHRSVEVPVSRSKPTPTKPSPSSERWRALSTVGDPQRTLHPQPFAAELVSLTTPPSPLIPRPWS